MPYKEKPVTKLYYSIGEVAERFKVNPSLIRFWEKEFNSIKPHKNKKGNRLFTEKDIENFELIYDLVKRKGFTLEGAKKELRHNRVDLQGKQQIIHKLEAVLVQLTTLRDKIAG